LEITSLGGGVLKSQLKIFKGKYEPKLEFPRGLGRGEGGNTPQKETCEGYVHVLEQHIISTVFSRYLQKTYN